MTGGEARTIVYSKRRTHLHRRPTAEIEQNEGACLPYALVAVRCKGQDRGECPLLQDGGVDLFSRDNAENQLGRKYWGVECEEEGRGGVWI